MAVDPLLENDQAYYEDPEAWGKSQYITLQNVIDNIMLTAGDDSYFKHASPTACSIHGKMGMKKLLVDIKTESRAIRIQLKPTLIFPFPRFMTDWVRIGVVNKCGNLEILEINETPTIHDYLQDHNWELLYDSEGRVLRGSDVDHQTGYCCLPIQCDDNPKTTCPDDTFKNSWVKANIQGGYFEFSPDLEDELIVIEFTSMGLQELDDCDVLIHNHLELTITRWIQWQLLLGTRNTSESRIERYYDLYKKEKKRSEALNVDLTLEGIVKSVGIRYLN